ncbi:MAG: flagellar motor protein MotB [Elusimicrobia bacterium]|nr:flagellar motor protein MotB [Elusimicrobiota bacterium]
MVPYADLMSNMMILFLALFALQYASHGALFDPVSKKVAGLKLSQMGVRTTDRYIHLTFPAPVLFSEGSAELTQEGRRDLAPLAELFAGLANPVLVSGFTDDRPIVSGRYRTNWELSAARAFAVIEFFTTRGLPASRFRARGYGEFRPVADNATPKGRRLNRRIEISLIREGADER